MGYSSRQPGYFNSHAHVERDIVNTKHKIRLFYFNSHAHVERDKKDIRHGKLKNHFNSHAHVERDITSTTYKNSRKISTHTLTWSVTYEFKGGMGECQFQLTRSRGA